MSAAARDAWNRHRLDLGADQPTADAIGDWRRLETGWAGPAAAWVDDSDQLYFTRRVFGPAGTYTEAEVDAVAESVEAGTSALLLAEGIVY